jgi:hypothetical protein
MLTTTASDRECIICYSACETEKKDMVINMNCTCKYYIHNQCFNEWCARNNGIGICLICRKKPRIYAVLTENVFFYLNDDDQYNVNYRPLFLSLLINIFYLVIFLLLILLAMYVLIRQIKNII